MEGHGVLLYGNMLVGVWKDSLIVRLGLRDFITKGSIDPGPIERRRV
jgi:hypothetical protein